MEKRDNLEQISDSMSLLLVLQLMAILIIGSKEPR